LHKLSDGGRKLFKDYASTKELGRTIMRESGVDELIIESRQAYDDKFGRSSVKTLKGGREYSLEELSDIVSSIKKTEEIRRKAIVACPKEKVKTVASVCDKFFKNFLKND